MGTPRSRGLELYRADSLVEGAQANPCPVLVLGLDATLLDANPGSWLILQEWRIAIGKHIPEPWLSTALAAATSGETCEATFSAGMVSTLLMFVPAQAHDCVYVFGADVSSQKHIEQKIALNAQVFESALEGILIMDADMRVVDVNAAYTTITGDTAEAVLGEPALFIRTDLQDPDFVVQLLVSLEQNGHWQGEVCGRRKDGVRYVEWLSVTRVKNDNGDPAHYTAHYIAVLTDITRQKEGEKQLFRMAHYDMLTGLPNRRLFQDRLDQAMASADRSKERIGIMLIDLDGFKLVNDHLGHRAGDEMLRIVSQRVGECVRSDDTVARMGGDEFLLLLRHLDDLENAAQIAANILQRIAESVILDNREFFLTASIGISGYNGDISSAKLFRLLDSAMYAAKADGKNGYRFVSDDVVEHAGERLTRQAKLRRALEQGEIKAYYQGIVDINENRLAGLEVLARWESPEEGIIAPDKFIPVAEESGLIRQLGEHILRTACTQGAAWRAAGIDTGIMSVNVSVRQLRDDDFVRRVEQILADTGFPPTLLDLELSEALWIQGKDIIIEKLTRLRALGITVSIDDFGTKYASLAYLKRLPVDRIKIDKSFINDIPSDASTSAIVTAVMTMAASMRLDVIAEGVEHRAQLEFLRARGCRYIQGYYYCRPGPAGSVPDLAARSHAIADRCVGKLTWMANH